MRIFMMQGMVSGVIGTTLGAVLGVLLANSITDLSLAVERFLNSVFTDANVYLLSHLQTKVSFPFHHIL